MERSKAPVPRAAWLTWERQRRNEGIARALGVPLFELVFPGSRLGRYIRAWPATARVLRTVRPDVLLVQNPSLVLALAAVMWGRIRRVPIVVDAHNAGLLPFGGVSGVLNRWASVVTRLASVTIVSNDRLVAQVRAYGGRPFVLPDPIPDLPSGNPPAGLQGRHRVLFICSYADDEPYTEVIEAARRLDRETVVYITGNPKAAARRLPEQAPDNVVFTGFLPEPEFIGLLRACDVVVDLTTRPDCLVCGAYEGVAAGKPLVLSDSTATRAYFSRGVTYTNNQAESIATCIQSALANRSRLSADIASLRRELVDDWRKRQLAFLTLLRELGQKRTTAVTE